MSLNDATIKDWSSDPAQNGPLGNELIAGGLDDQFRNIKAIVRQESLEKQWITVPYTVQKVNDTQFRIQGALGGAEGSTQLCQKNRKVLMLGTSTTAVGTITAQESETISAQVWTKCTIYPDVFGGVVPNGISEVRFGALTSVNSAIPGNVLTSTSNVMYGSVALPHDSANGTTRNYSATLGEFTGNLNTGQVIYLKFPEVNVGAVWVRINGGSYLEIKKISSNSAPIPSGTLSSLTAADLAPSQTIAVVYDATANAFVMLSPPAMTISAGDLASTLFTANTSSYDTDTCISGGYFKLMRNLALVWCKTNVVPVSSYLEVKLPLYYGNMATTGSISSVKSVVATKVKSADYSEAAFVVTTNDYGLVTVRNPNATKSENAYLLAVVGLAYSG
jgi:hypothetical protein